MILEKKIYQHLLKVLIIGLNMEQLHITKKNFLIKQFNEKPLIKNQLIWVILYLKKKLSLKLIKANLGFIF